MLCVELHKKKKKQTKNKLYDKIDKSICFTIDTIFVDPLELNWNGFLPTSNVQMLIFQPLTLFSSPSSPIFIENLIIALSNVELG